MSVVAHLTNLVAQYGYPGLALLVGAEGFGLPAPGQTAIIVSGGYASHGELTIVGVAVVAFLAAVTGDSIGYLIGRTGGRRLILRHGRYVRLTSERLARLESVMSRHGPRIIAVARFVDGLRQFNGVIAGATGMPWRRFAMSNALGAATWVAVWATVGYLAGDHVRAIEAGLHHYQWYAVVSAALAALAYTGWRLTRRHWSATGAAAKTRQ